MCAAMNVVDDMEGVHAAMPGLKSEALLAR